MTLSHLGALSVASPDAARSQILAALTSSDGNVTRAASTLGVQGRQLRRLLDRLALWTTVDERWPERHPGPPRGPRV